MAKFDANNTASRPNSTGSSSRKEPPTRMLTVVQRRKYGAVEIEFGISAPYEPIDAGDQSRYMRLLTKQVDDMHEEWAIEQLPNIRRLERNENMPQTFRAISFRYDEKGRLRLLTHEPDYAQYGALVPNDLMGKVNQLTNDLTDFTNVVISVVKLDKAGIVREIYTDATTT